MHFHMLKLAKTKNNALYWSDVAVLFIISEKNLVQLVCGCPSSGIFQDRPFTAKTGTDLNKLELLINNYYQELESCPTVAVEGLF